MAYWYDKAEHETDTVESECRSSSTSEKWDPYLPKKMAGSAPLVFSYFLIFRFGSEEEKKIVNRHKIKLIVHLI